MPSTEPDSKGLPLGPGQNLWNFVARSHGRLNSITDIDGPQSLTGCPVMATDTIRILLAVVLKQPFVRRTSTAIQNKSYISGNPNFLIIFMGAIRPMALRFGDDQPLPNTAENDV